MSFNVFLPLGAPNKTNPTRCHLPGWCEPDSAEQLHFESPVFKGDQLRVQPRWKENCPNYGYHQEAWPSTP